MSATNPLPAHRRDESGAIGIMFAGALIVLFGFFALSLDLSQLYNRKMELQTVADTAALAAAAELNGTAGGVANALASAAAPFSASSGAPTYGYGHRKMAWSDVALTFGASPSGPWQSAQAARARADGLLYVKVDTAGLADDYGKVDTMFVSVLGKAAVTATGASAIAGRSAINVTPLGICAMRDQAQRSHNGELEEYGFRRGVAYNLLDLNRSPAPAGVTYIVNPLPGNTPVTDAATLAPFVCTGTMAMARLSGGQVSVSTGFPIASLYNQFNSRFGLYNGAANVCDQRTAPSDVNVKEYAYNGGALWMSATPQQQAALPYSGDRRWTVAGPDTTPAGTTAAQYGPLWSFAKAVPYSAFVAGAAEPAGGSASYAIADWATLYNPGKPKTSTTTPYPAAAATPTPYSTTNGAFYKAPPTGNRAVARRRVLNLPLLACPVADNKATVRAIGKFFMPVQATASSLYGEFAGLASDQSLGTQVVLYP